METPLTLAKLRLKAGLTQRQLSIALDLTEATIRAWENGRHKPRLTIPQTIQLMEVLNCSIQELNKAIENQEQLKTAG